MKIFYLFLPFFLFSLSFKENLEKGTPGDYVLFEQNKQLTCLILKNRSHQTVILEEISAPKDQVLSIEQWLKDFTPHSSWTLTEIDMEKNKVLNAFSLTDEKKTLPSSSFFSLLLNASLEKTPAFKRRKIGPLQDGPDHRPFWTPVIEFNDQKTKKDLSPYLFTYPNDRSELAGKSFEIYFKKRFPFPLWIELVDQPIHFIQKAVKAGTGLHSPKTLPVKFFSLEYKKNLELFIDPSCGPFELFALKKTDNEFIPLSFTVKNFGFTHHLTADPSPLTENTLYTFFIISKKNKEIRIETKEPVLWKKQDFS